MFQQEPPWSSRRSLEPDASKTDRRRARHSLDSLSIKKCDHRCHVTKLWTRILSYASILAIFWIALRAMFTVDPSNRVQFSATSQQRPNLLSLSPSHESPLSHQVPNDIQTTTCAIILFGLPRAFRRLVLPSLEQNVIKINTPRYGCDYYVHWFSDIQEPPSRSGMGGLLDDISTLSLSLKRVIVDAHLHSNPSPLIESPKVVFASDSNETFWIKYGSMMNRVLTETGRRAFRKYHAVNPRLLYWPVKDKSYNAQTLVNVVKMWHSIQSAFRLTEGVRYDRVAMLRSDVVYLTPVDIWKYPKSTTSSSQTYDYDTKNQYVVVPGGFAMYPVNDRLIYGPTSAVRIWSTQRFALLEEHVHKTILEKDPGFGMHNERFLFHSIFPRMKVPIQYDKSVCFVRARADLSIWINDCGSVGANCRAIEQDLLRGKSCRRPLQPLDPNIHTGVVQLFCDNVE